MRAGACPARSTSAGRPASEAAERVADVLQDAVAREDEGPLRVTRGGGQGRLLEDERAAPVAAHRVRHPEEGGGGEGERMRAEGESGAPAGGGEAEPEERPPGADPLAAEGHEEGARGRPGQARARDEADRSRIEADPGEVHAEEDAEEPRGERAQEGAQVEEGAVAHRRHVNVCRRGWRAARSHRQVRRAFCAHSARRLTSSQRTFAMNAST